MMVNSNTALIRGVGKPALELKIQFFKAIFLYFPSIFIGTYFYGIIGAAYAIVFNKAVSVVIAQYFLKKLFNITIKDLWNTINLPLLLLVAIVPIIYWLYEYLMVNYILCGIILFLLYFCSCYLFAKTEIKSFIASMRNVND
jgi:O-antigen/teichoic acid export membrane protein